jgi:hypothetical protein
MYPARESVPAPAVLFAVRLTVYVPEAVYVWVVFFAALSVVLNHRPSPNDQFHVEGAGVPDEVSLKLTVSGTVPDTGVPLNAMTGNDEMLMSADTFQPSAEALTVADPPSEGVKVVVAR